MDLHGNLEKKGKTIKRILLGFLIIGLAAFGNTYAIFAGAAPKGDDPGNLYTINHADFLPAPSQTEIAPSPSYLPGQVIVKMKKGRSLKDIQGLNQKYRVKATRELFKKTTPLNQLQQRTPSQLANRLEIRQKRAPKGLPAPNLDNILVMDLPEGTTDLTSIIKQYQKNPNVEYAEPNYTYKIQMVPNDPYYSSQNSWGQGYDDLWGLKQIQAPSAWDLSQGAGVVVAVVDTGIDYRHEDIAINSWTNPGEITGNRIDDDGNGYVDDVYGYDFCNNDCEPRDDNGHGTHVAGTIAAVGNNSRGIIGVAPQAKVMAVKGLDSTGSGTSEALAKCIRYAADNGADVLNNSWGGADSSQVIIDAINYAVSKGCLVVAAAGNSNKNVTNEFPACLDQLIAVAASRYDGTKCPFSNWGRKVDVSAPGGDISGTGGNILSLLAANSTLGHTYPERIIGTNYLRLQGTSMACPHVAGLAALLLAYFPQSTSNDIRGRIMATTNPVAQPTGSAESPYIGTGIINAYNALTTPQRAYLRIDTVEAAEDQGDNDGIIESYESVKLVVRLENVWKSAASVTVTLSSQSPYVASIINPICSLGTVGEFQTVDNAGTPLVFSTQGIEYDTPIELTLTINVDGFVQTQTTTVYAGIRRLSVDKINLSPLATSDNNLTWVGLSNDHLVNNCYFYDFTTNREINLTNDPFCGADNPDISGNNIVWYDWSDNNSQDIYLYDLNRNQLRQITHNPANQSYPAISGNRIIWQDQRNNGFDIYLFDLAKNQEFRITKYTRGSSIYPQISGNLILWVEETDFILYDLETRQERKISSGTGEKWWVYFYQSKIVWSEKRDPNGYYQIYLYDIRTSQETCLTSDPCEHDFPKIFGDRMVWSEYYVENDQVDIYLYDLNTRQKTRITRGPGDKFSAVINDQRIYWLDTREPEVLQALYCVNIPACAAPPMAPVISSSIYLSNSELHANWTCSDPLYEIIEYQYAIGTEPGATDVVDWTSTGSTPEVMNPNLNLTLGRTYYLSVKAKHDAGLWSAVAVASCTSQDIPAPIAFVNDGPGPDLQYTAGPEQLSANWNASGGGASGIKNYWYAIGTTPGGTDLADWTANGLETNVTRTGLNLIQGQTYYFTVKAENSAGYQTASVSSNGQTVDLSPPVNISNLQLTIYAGPSLVGFDDGVHNEFKCIITASWTGASDPDSGITGYLYAVGTSPGAHDLVDWVDNGTAASFSRYTINLNMVQGKTYYCSARAINGAGSASNVTVSNGQVFDLTPPEKITTVNDGAGVPDVAFTPYLDRLLANWSAALDRETGISKYTYCVGTGRGLDNVVPWTDNGLSTSVTRTGLNLVNGLTYYFSVKAYNGMGFASEFTASNGQTVDTSPPAPPGTVNDGSGADIQFTGNTSQLTANWTPGTDPESGLLKYYYAIGTIPGADNLAGWTDNGANTSVTRTGLNLVNGRIYYFSVKAVNCAGLESVVASSNGLIVDTTPPTLIATVNDGSGADIQFTPDPTQLAAHWTPSEDAESGVVKYLYAIGTAPRLMDVRGWTDNGLTTTAEMTDLNLTQGTTYYISVIAVNGAGLYSGIASSNGQTVDITPPQPINAVYDGLTIGIDIESTPSITQLSANWTATSDPESYVIAYYYAVGTAPGLTDVVSWTHNGVNTKFTKTGLSLVIGQTYYVSVKAMNVVGQISAGATSNGQTVIPASVKIFSDNFEGGFTGWTPVGPITWYTGAPKNGTHSVLLQTTAALKRTVSTVGYTNISVSFYMGAHSLDSIAEIMQASWYDGSAWNPLKTIMDGTEDNLLHQYQLPLPAAAADNPSFAVRFKLNGNSADDYGYIDNVVIKGIPGVTPTPTPNPTPTKFFSDNFETSFSDWTSNGAPIWYTGAPKNGTHSIQFQSTSNVKRTISTVGYQGIIVSFYLGASGLDTSAESMQAFWSSDGAAWELLTQITDGTEDNSLHFYQFSLPETAANNPNFALKCRLTGNSADDYGYIDNVVVKGTPIPVNGHTVGN